MNLISAIFFLISFIILYSMLRKDSDALSPIKVFGLTWSIVFALANLKLSRLQLEWMFSQWAYVLMGPISFMIGLFIANILYLGTKYYSINEMRQILQSKTINGTKLFYLILVAFVTYICGYIIIALTKGGLPIFALNPSAVRTEFSVFGIGLFLYHPPVIVFFSVVYHLLVKNNKGKKLILKIVAFITILTYLLLLQRYQLIMIFIMIFTLLYYVTHHIRFRTILLFSIIGIAVIILVATLRSGKIVQLVLYKTSQMKYSYEYAIFTEPYMYIVMNVENFANSVTKLDQHTYGYYTFNYVLSLTGLRHWLEGYFGIIDTPYLFSGFNTYTLFWTFYRDFGLIGLSLIPLFLGLLVGSIYYKMRLNPTLNAVILYCVIVFVMALSFFVNILGFLWFVYILAWMWLILKYTQVKNTKS